MRLIVWEPSWAWITWDGGTWALRVGLEGNGCGRAFMISFCRVWGLRLKHSGFEGLACWACRMRGMYGRGLRDHTPKATS